MSSLVRISDRMRLAPGQETVQGSPHEVATIIRRERRAGRLAEVSRWEVSPGRHVAIVQRLKPRPRRRRVAALWLSGAAVAVAAIGAATWWVAVHLSEILTAVGGLLLATVGLLILTRVLSGHRPACAGLHCPGCRH